ncbi:MAG: Leucine rich repeat protein [Fibrobacteres bacterium]|nr:Leucine rich repeat protein [Fibrobacterota bacterium]
MKIRNPFFFLAALATLSVCAPAYAQDFVQDTLAVRLLLDQNGLVSTPASQVITVESDRVSALKLSGLKLVKLPAEIGGLSALKYLTLTDNLLDSVPGELWDLSQLVELDLGGNRLKALDPKVANLKKLLLLGLRDNGLPSLPGETYTLVNLTTLLLAGNSLDTLPEAIANLPFLQYLDLSDNLLRTIPFTVAAMDKLDSLDLSSNLLESLPDLITEMNAATKVHLGANRLCNLDAPLDAWAKGKEPGYQATQICGAGVRQVAAGSSGPVLRALSDGKILRVDMRGLGNTQGTLEIVFRDVSGRMVLRMRPAEGARALEIPWAALGRAQGFLWAELRVGGKSAAVAPVLPG